MRRIVVIISGLVGVLGVIQKNMEKHLDSTEKNRLTT